MKNQACTQGLLIRNSHNTGQVRSWMESYDHFGQVSRVHPKMINGQTVNFIHYPPIGSEIRTK